VDRVCPKENRNKEREQNRVPAVSIRNYSSCEQEEKKNIKDVKEDVDHVVAQGVQPAEVVVQGKGKIDQGTGGVISVEVSVSGIRKDKPGT